MKKVYYFLIPFVFVFSFTKSQNNKFTSAIGIEPFLYIPNKLIGQIIHNKSNSSLILGFRYPSFNNAYNTKKNYDYEIGVKKYFWKTYGPQIKLLYRKYEGLFDYYDSPIKGIGYTNHYVTDGIKSGVISLGYYYKYKFKKYGFLELNINLEYQHFFNKLDYIQWYGKYRESIINPSDFFEEYYTGSQITYNGSFVHHEKPYYYPFNIQFIYHFKRN